MLFKKRIGRLNQNGETGQSLQISGVNRTIGANVGCGCGGVVEIAVKIWIVGAVVIAALLFVWLLRVFGCQCCLLYVVPMRFCCMRSVVVLCDCVAVFYVHKKISSVVNKDGDNQSNCDAELST